ncbi:MAG: energy transducer TonB, partial [Proteobacteria bacterium]|nr:energy transducer TonB [Pseudomonadota bacterium]
PLRTAVAASAAAQSETKPDEPKLEEKPPEPQQPPALEPPPPPTPPAPEPEAALPKEATPPPAQTASAAAVAPVEATSAPQVAAPTVAAVAKAQSIGTPSEHDRRAVAAWQNRLLDLIERNKRYPAQALAHRSQGTTTIAFRIDRHGRLLDAEVVSSSGSPALDEEALALMRRAQPFPVPPTALPDSNLSLSVPIRFIAR